MKVVLVYNPRSGTAPSLGELRRYFKEADIAISVAIAVDDGYEKKVGRHIKSGQIIAVVGGDGTINGIVNLLQGTKAVLAPLPGGTLNHFTKDLGITQDIEQAIKRLKTASVRTIDYATVNDRAFINNSSIGLYPSSLQARARIEDRLGKWPAAIIGSLRAWIKYQPYQVTIAGKEVDTPFIFIGNNDYRIEKMATGGRKHLDKGVLSVYTIAAKTRWQFIQLILRAISGRLQDIPEIKSWKTSSITIRSRKPALRVSYDGEVAKLETPLTYAVVAGGLRVIGS